MKKLGYSILLTISLFTSIALVISSCDLMQENSLQYGSLSVTTNSFSSRTIEPSNSDMSIMSYRVTGTGPHGETFDPVISATSPITVENLVVGTWSITVDGFNENDHIVQTATQNIEIAATETTSATLFLDYPSGLGDFELTIEWPENITTVYSATVTISPSEGENTSYTFYASDADVIDGMKTLVGDVANLPTGSYALVLKFYDSNSDQIGYSMMEQVHIYKDLTSTGTFTMPEYFFPVETPIITPDGGRIPPTQTISITTTTEDADIYYTTDGTDPTTASNEYVEPFTLGSNKTVKAIAVRDDMYASGINSKNFEIPASTPVFSIPSGIYPDQQTISISSATSDATIYYTTNGTDPTSSSALYSGTIAISQNTTVKAIAVHPDYGDSDVSAAEYKIRSPEPSFSIREGTYGSSQTLELSSDVAGASIYYTTDGSEPTLESTEYSTPLLISETTTVKAMAILSNMTESTVVSHTYNILAYPAVSNPIMTPIEGSYPKISRNV